MRPVALAAAVIAALLAVPSAIASGDGGFPPICEYVEAGPPGPRGNMLVLTQRGGEIELRRDGPRIEIAYNKCAGPQATVHNVDRIVLHADGDTVRILETDGPFAPGATPERAGSEIEIVADTNRLEVSGSDRDDSIRAATLPSGRVAVDLDVAADGRRPDYDVVATNGIPAVLKLSGGGGGDLIDARRVTGMGDLSLHHVVRLIGGPGADTILGSPNMDWRIKDGSGNDLVLAGGGDDEVDFGRGRDRTYRGPGDDSLSYSAWERFSGSPPDAGDRLYGGSGRDYLSDLNRHRDEFHCGPGSDLVDTEPADSFPEACERRR
jgi:hypothetical protein